MTRIFAIAVIFSTGSAQLSDHVLWSNSDMASLSHHVIRNALILPSSLTHRNHAQLRPERDLFACIGRALYERPYAGRVHAGAMRLVEHSCAGVGWCVIALLSAASISKNNL